ncbi:expressed unknown protein [Seminavis robusta]|uniref:F-box domain-containing protein n=1 Tax=Seminavis robusta TaxID=568900 RepID=A0A9N8EJA4_9STRA|nr:expressed unknown protein [Seminavis robusta]|eukprot:Sro1077_g238600.1 n/a (426) ;mRNA; r:17341-18618
MAMSLFVQPPLKKRRLNPQPTLLDYFPVVIGHDDGNDTCGSTIRENWMFGFLPTEVLQKFIFPLMTVQDLTNLSQTCRQAASLVDTFRGPLPYIVREELLPRKLSYVNMEHHMGSPNDKDCDYFDVSRSRTLRFLLKTRRHRVVQVQVKIGTTLWAEVLNESFPCGPRYTTWVEVKIYRQVKESHKPNMTRILLFENAVSYNDDEGAKYYYMEGYQKTPQDQCAQEMMNSKLSSKLVPDALCHGRTTAVESINSSGGSKESLSMAVEGNHRDCANYIWKCANRIAASPTHYNLPNLDFLIEQALPPSLHCYLPNKYVIDDVQKYLGPLPEALWKHRKAPSPQARRLFLNGTGNRRRDQHGQLTKEYLIHDIPWYSEWYPRRAVLSPRNLLQSLPPKLAVSHIVPFLDKSDTAALRAVCPKLETVW